MKKAVKVKILTILIWTACFFLWALRGWWYLAAGIFLLHSAEVFLIGIRTGRENNVSVYDSIILTLVFGVAWWMPLRNAK